ncbi:alpha/beta-hydrolase, partial [Pilatotrama ljubarskyi]
GFVAGSLDVDDGYLRSLCVGLRLSIVNVGYRLAPEHPFPIGFKDACNGNAFSPSSPAAAHASKLDGSLKRGFLVGGVSAGANLAGDCCCTTIPYNRSLCTRPPISPAPLSAGLALPRLTLRLPLAVHPAADVSRYVCTPRAELRSLEEQANVPFSDYIQDPRLRQLELFTHALRAPPNDLRVSPLLAPSHTELPRAYLQVFGLDPLRDEGLLYVRLSREAGVEVQLATYPGRHRPHGYNMVFPGTKAAVKVDEDLRAGIDWLLSLRTWKKRSSSVCQIA